MTNEEWAEIEDTNGMYDISNRGRVRSWFNNRYGRLSEPRILKPGARKGSTPYLIVALTMADGRMRTHYVHRLVAKYFLPPAPSDRHEIGHGIEGSLVNNFENLSWVTRSENEQEKSARQRMLAA